MRAQGRGDQGSGSEHAIVGDLRALLPQSPGVSRAGPAGLGRGARLGGTGVDSRLGAVCRPQRPKHRHGDVRGIGAAERTAEEVRLSSRKHRRGSQGATCQTGVTNARRSFVNSTVRASKLRMRFECKPRRVRVPSPLLARRGGRDTKRNIAKLPLMERTGWWFKIKQKCF